MDKIVTRIPVGRLGDPNEVARVVEFLADPESGYMTGASSPSMAACTCSGRGYHGPFRINVFDHAKAGWVGLGGAHPAFFAITG